MFLPSLVPAVLVTLLATGTVFAQQTPEPNRCSETVKRLDRELGALSERLERPRTAQTASTPVPPWRVLAELMEMVALREHLRCLGVNPQDQRKR